MSPSHGDMKAKNSDGDRLAPVLRVRQKPLDQEGPESALWLGIRKAFLWIHMTTYASSLPQSLWTVEPTLLLTNNRQSHSSDLAHKGLQNLLCELPVKRARREWLSKT